MPKEIVCMFQMESEHQFLNFCGSAHVLAGMVFIQTLTMMGVHAYYVVHTTMRTITNILVVIRTTGSGHIPSH